MKYNKSDVMKTAWSLFRQGVWTGDMEYVYVHRQNRKATFSDCLKEAWAKEKAYIKEKEEAKVNAPKSEEAKAWDWACRKLGVDLQHIDPTQKVRHVDEMAKEMWTSNVWAQAIKAVKLYVEIEEYLAS